MPQLASLALSSSLAVYVDHESVVFDTCDGSVLEFDGPLFARVLGAVGRLDGSADVYAVSVVDSGWEARYIPGEDTDPDTIELWSGDDRRLVVGEREWRLVDSVASELLGLNGR
jgi:hypothetical protein